MSAFRPHPREPHPPDHPEAQRPVLRVWIKPQTRTSLVPSPEEPLRRGEWRSQPKPSNIFPSPTSKSSGCGQSQGDWELGARGSFQNPHGLTKASGLVGKGHGSGGTTGSDQALKTLRSF